MAINDHDERSIRCPRLGHLVSFHYCRTQEGSSICPRILDCWWEVFDVRSFLAEHLPPEQLKWLESGAGADRVGSLLRLIQEAKKRARKG